MDQDTADRIVFEGLEAEARTLGSGLIGFVTTLGTGLDPVASEEALRACIFSFGRALTERALSASDAAFTKALQERGHEAPDGTICRGTLRSKGRKETALLSLMGEVRFERATFACTECGRWLAPADDALAVTNGMTAATASVVAQMGALLPFEQAQKTLESTAGLKVDDNRIARTVEAAAPRVQQLNDGDPKDLLDETGYPPAGAWVTVLVDGGRVRMRDLAWREPCAALMVWKRADGSWAKLGVSDPQDKDYVLGVVDGWLETLRLRGKRNVAIIADGAEWIWHWAAKHPWTVQVLDYYHAREHVWACAKAMFAEGEPDAARWVERTMDRVWDGSASDVAQSLRAKAGSHRTTEASRGALRSLATYLDNHEGLMNYAERRREGCAIGSGMIESFCKQLFSMRMKGAGMFWSEPGARAVMDLRTAYLTDRWRLLWKRRPARAA